MFELFFNSDCAVFSAFFTVIWYVPVFSSSSDSIIIVIIFSPFSEVCVPAIVIVVFSSSAIAVISFSENLDGSSTVKI